MPRIAYLPLLSALFATVVNAQSEVIDQFSTGATELQGLIPIIAALVGAFLLIALIATVGFLIVRSFNNR